MYLVPNKISGNSITHFAQRDNEKPPCVVHSGLSRRKCLILKLHQTTMGLSGSGCKLSPLDAMTLRYHS